jgi:hypothetical protein
VLPIAIVACYNIYLACNLGRRESSDCLTHDEDRRRGHGEDLEHSQQRAGCIGEFSVLLTNETQIVISSAPILATLLCRDQSRIPTTMGDTARNTMQGMITMPAFDWASYSRLPGVAISSLQTVCSL